MEDPAIEAMLLEGVTEAEFQRQVEIAARTLGYLVYHTHDSRRCEEGFPDLVIVPGPSSSRGIGFFAELKKQKGGEISEEQVEWLKALFGVREWRVRLWKPSDAGAIWEELQTGVDPGANWEESLSGLYRRRSARRRRRGRRSSR